MTFSWLSEISAVDVLSSASLSSKKSTDFFWWSLRGLTTTALYGVVLPLYETKRFMISFLINRLKRKFIYRLSLVWPWNQLCREVAHFIYSWQLSNRRKIARMQEYLIANDQFAILSDLFNFIKNTLTFSFAFWG
jgi:hypothetical protein